MTRLYCLISTVCSLELIAAAFARALSPDTHQLRRSRSNETLRTGDPQIVKKTAARRLDWETMETEAASPHKKVKMVRKNIEVGNTPRERKCKSN